MKHNQIIKNETLLQQISFMAKDIKELRSTIKITQEHIMQVEKALSENPFTRDWFVEPKANPCLSRKKSR